VLEVADICSGANYLTSILAIGLPLAYLQLSRGWSRAVLLLSALVVGVVANWLRVILISIMAYYDYPVLHGPLHVFQGAFVGWVGFLYLFLVYWVLSKTRYEASIRVEQAPPPLCPRPEREGRDGGWRLWVSVGCLAIIFAATAAGAAFLDRPPHATHFNLESIPKQVGKWIGRTEDPLSSPFRMPGAGREIFRRYEKTNGDVLYFYVAHFESQRQGEELVSARARALYEASHPRSVPTMPPASQGIEEGRSKATVNVVDSFPLPGRRVGGKAHALFWYEVAGEREHRPLLADLKLIRNALLKGKRDGAFFIVWEVGGPSLVKENQTSAIDEFLRKLFSESPLSPTRT
jgi:EpsI family protein